MGRLKSASASRLPGKTRLYSSGLGFFATVIGVFSYGGDISDCNGGFLQRC